MTERTRRTYLAFVGAAIFAGTVSGCASGSDSDQSAGSGSDLSRVRLYANVAEMAADSKLVVVGTATRQSVAADIDPNTDFTLSDVRIVKVLRGADVTTGTSVIVRQSGSDKQTPPVPLLQPGRTYLLYLTASGLDGPLSSQYYITGANAGIYALPANSRAATDPTPATPFAQVQRQNGENLPATLNSEQALG